MIYSNFQRIDITVFSQRLDAASKLAETDLSSVNDLSKTDVLIRNLKEAINNHKEDFILDVALHPEKRKVWRDLGGKIRKLDPQSFKEIQKAIGEIQHTAINKQKVIVACNKFGMELNQYEELMAEFGGKVNEILDVQDGLTPLRKAIALNNQEFVNVLHELGADLNLCDSSNYTPLLWAVEKKNPEMVWLLNELGADLNTCNRTGWTPVKIAITMQNSEMVEMLKDLGADLNLCIGGSSTPLEWAIENKSADMVHLLVKLGANINFCNFIYGGTPIIFALQKKLPEMVLLLQNLGADLDMRDIKDITPLRFAIDRNDPQSVLLLKRLGADLNLPNLVGLPPLAEALMKGKFNAAFALEKVGVDKEFNNRIQKNVELAHIWGLKGIIPISFQEKIIDLHLEGMPAFNGMKLLNDFSDKFFRFFSEISEAHLAQPNRTSIQNALKEAYPLVNKPDEMIVEIIKAENPYVIEAGITEHGIAFVFCKGKMIVCNRGLGSKEFACTIYNLPRTKLTPELIAQCKTIYPDIGAFKKMIKDQKLTKEGGYKQEVQGVGNCAWASAKAAFGALLRQYAISEADGEIIYKLFTEYCRKITLKDYLDQIKPPDLELLKLLYEKLEEKSGFEETKLLVGSAIENLRNTQFSSYPSELDSLNRELKEASPNQNAEEIEKAIEAEREIKRLLDTLNKPTPLPPPSH